MFVVDLIIGLAATTTEWKEKVMSTCGAEG